MSPSSTASTLVALGAGAHVLHQSVRREHVVPDLAAEVDGALLVVAGLRRALARFELDLVELGLEHAHGHRAVLVLAALGAADDVEARRQVARRTAVSTLFTFCPPLPPARIVVISMSLSGTSMSMSSSSSGTTSTAAKAVWRV
jgi:homoserine acetyltransferase